MSGERFEKEFASMLELLERHESVLVTGHIDPDGDCVGSMFSIAMLLEAMGKKVICYAPGEISELFLKLPGASTLKGRDEAADFKHDLVIAVDSPNTARTENFARACADEDVINIDHHPTNEMYGCVNIVDGAAAATTVLVYRFFKAMAPEKLTPEIADCLYLGILMDTGGFRFQNVDSEALRIASELIEKGARAYELAHEFIYVEKFATLRLLGLVLDSLRLHHDGRVATMEVTSEMLERTGTTMKDSEGFVDYGAALDDVELVALFRENAPDEVRVSLRSRNHHDVSALAERFGGGGHVRAAGLTIEGSLESAKKTIVDGFGELLG
jgi:phosphoesterase RecJ-like protein